MRYRTLYTTRTVLAVLLCCGWLSSAQAHAHLRGSTPTEGAVLKSAPAELVLQLSEPARLTAVSIQRAGDARRPLRAPEAAASEIRLALPALTAGKYLVSWRALSDDGHVTSGTLHFTLQP